MPLSKLEEFDPNYIHNAEGCDVKAMALYTEGEKWVGPIDEVLVDNEGSFRYLVISTGFWGLGKKVMVPISLIHIDYDAGRVYIDGLSNEQVESLTEYKEEDTIDEDFEEQVKSIYNAIAKQSAVPTKPSL